MTARYYLADPVIPDDMFCDATAFVALGRAETSFIDLTDHVPASQSKHNKPDVQDLLRSPFGSSYVMAFWNRQQKAAALEVMGYSKAEIAAMLGDQS